MLELYPLLVSVFAAVFAGSYFGVNIGNVLLQPIDVPPRMEQNGYNVATFNQLVLDEVQRVYFAAGPDYVGANVSEATEGMKISAYGADISLARIRTWFARAEGSIKYEFSGVVVEREGRLVLMLTGQSNDGLRNFFTDTAAPEDPQALVKDAARDILSVVDPYVLMKLQFEDDKLTGDFSKSLAMIQALFARLQPAQYHYLFNIAGRALDLSGRDDLAIEAYRKAISSDPNFAIAYSNLALTMRKLGRTKEADELDRTALRVAPGFYGFFRFWAETYYRAEDNQRCVYNFSRFLVYEKRDARAYYEMSSCLRALGRLAEAEAALNQAVALNPDLGALVLKSAAPPPPGR
jgi:tetratricopeptide (TPR) repeat protein